MSDSAMLGSPEVFVGKERKRREIFSGVGSSIRTLLRHPSLSRRSHSKSQAREVQSDLCSMCYSVLVTKDYNENQYNSKYPENFPFTFETLENSAADGCPVCCRMLDKFSREFYDQLQDARTSSVKFKLIKQPVPPGRLQKESLYLLAQFYFPNLEGALSRGLSHALLLVPAQHIEPWISTRRLSTYTGSDSSLMVCREWLDTCNTGHPSCALASTTFMPTRLLDLGDKNGSPKVSLYEVSSSTERLTYAALSHCWGGKAPLTLTQSQLHSMKNGITEAQLPKTLQDAILVVRSLGIRYLWADTLCIIQDSVADWQKESMQMGNIYKNAACTIAASGASNGDVPGRNTRDGKIMSCIDPYIWLDHIENGPLNLRAWVLQEMFLSPRIIHFGQQQIFYTCREMEVCEVYPNGIPHEVGIKTGELHMASNQLSESNSDYNWHMDIWSKIVHEYSLRKLTKGEDKLVALSGLAKEIKSRTGDDYLAGLWRRSLPTSLLWAVSNSRNNDRCRFPGYRAPSWSWAALDGYIILDFHQKQTGYVNNLLVEVREVNVISAIGDVMTQVTNGFISLKGRLTTCSCVWSSRMGSWILHVDTAKGEQTSFGANLDENRVSKITVRDLYCIPILLSKSKKYMPNEVSDTIDCLLLQYNQEMKTFTRFGTYSTGRSNEFDHDEIRDACDFFDASTSRNNWDYEDTDEGKKYVITVI